MSTQPHLSPHQHPVITCAATVAAAIDDVVGVETTYLSAGDKRAVLLELTAAIARLEEIRLRVLAAGQALGDVAEADGSRNAAAWLAHHARLDPGRARHLSRLATALNDRWAEVGAALRAGTVDLAQAAVIVDALDRLPDDVPVEVRRAAEERLVAEAAHFDPRRLRVLGRRILDVVAPDLADEAERRQLEDEEAHAARSTFLRLRRRGDGTTDVHARIADALADRLAAYLHAYTSPRRQTRQHAEPSPPASPPASTPAGEHVEAESPPPAPPPAPPCPAQDRRPYDQRLGHAFGAFLEHADPARMPLHGGDATTLVVTIDLDALRSQLATTGVALIGDEPITAAQTRRLACTANLIPAVLGADSQVLDLGRTRRLFSPAQRKALALQHPTCAAEGCTIPAPWCEAHHVGNPWSHGGRTDFIDGTLLCSWHHHRAHDPRYDTTRHPDGTVTFHRRI